MAPAEERQYASLEELLDTGDEAAKGTFLMLMQQHLQKQGGALGDEGLSDVRVRAPAPCLLEGSAHHRPTAVRKRPVLSPDTTHQQAAFVEVLENRPEVVAQLLDAINRGVRLDLDGSGDEGDASPVASLAAEARAVRPRPAASRPEGVTITPQAHFVVKTKDGAGRKVMLNVCGHPQVPAPGDWPHGQVPLAVKEAMEAQAGGDAAPVRYPLSCGAARDFTDDDGSSVAVVDVVFNDTVARGADTYPALKSQVVQLALSAVAAKTGWVLDPQVKLPRRKCYDAPPRPQRVQKDSDKAPLVAELARPQAHAEPAPVEPPSFPLRVAPLTPPAAPKQAKPAGGAGNSGAGAVASHPPPALGVTVHPLQFDRPAPGTPVEAVTVRVVTPARYSGQLAVSVSPAALSLRDASTGAHLATVPMPGLELDAAAGAAWVESDADSTAERPTVALCARLPVVAYQDAAQAMARAADVSPDAYLDLVP